MNVDTVEERTEILFLDDGGLMDSGAALRYFFEVDALEGEVVLLFLFSGDEDSLGGVDSLVHFETQEVLDFEGFAVVKDVDHDREMGVGQDHSEFVAGGDSGDHVADDTSHGAEHCVSLLLLEPHSELETVLVLFGLFLSHFEWDVAETFGELAEWALDCDSSGFDFDFDAVWDFELLFRNYVLHYSYMSGNKYYNKLI